MKKSLQRRTTKKKETKKYLSLLFIILFLFISIEILVVTTNRNRSYSLFSQAAAKKKTSASVIKKPLTKPAYDVLPTSSPTNCPQKEDQHYFPETQHCVKGVFYNYWKEHGGLAQQGYPLSEELIEPRDVDGVSVNFTVQYFERAIFEYHPENAGSPFEVLLTQLGTAALRDRYPRYTSGENPAQKEQPNMNNRRVFRETGKGIGGHFRAYWDSQGGLAQQGYPLTEEFKEASFLNGKEYTVQYFERAVFEYHPENTAPYDVLLAQLGKFALRKNYPIKNADLVLMTAAEFEASAKALHCSVEKYYWKDFNVYDLGTNSIIKVTIPPPEPNEGYPFEKIIEPFGKDKAFFTKGLGTIIGVQLTFQWGEKENLVRPILLVTYPAKPNDELFTHVEVSPFNCEQATPSPTLPDS